MAAKKVVLKVQIHEEKDKKKAFKKISSLSGIESIAMDMKEKKLTITGEVDVVEIVDKLRKHWNTEVLTIGPAKEPEKNKEDKKDEGKEKDKEIDEIAELLKKYYSHYNYNPYYTHYYHH